MACRNRVVVQVTYRDLGLAGDYSFGIVKVGDVVRTKARERDGEAGLARAAADATCALRVVGGGGRDVSHEDGPQISDVNAQLEGGRAAEDVDVALDELALDLPGLLGGQLCRVLLDVDR